jgi:ribonuclease VapC
VKTRVLDSWPILEWINGRQPSTGILRKLFDEAGAGQARLMMSAINVGEVYYFLRKFYTRDLAEAWRGSARTLPVTIDVPTGEDIWKAATLKAEFPISYADAFAAALAQRNDCKLLTGDPGFRSVDELQIHWLGRR